MDKQLPRGIIGAIHHWEFMTVPATVFVFLSYLIGIPVMQAQQSAPARIHVISTLPSLGTPGLGTEVDGSMTPLEPGMPIVCNTAPPPANVPVSRERQAAVMAKAREEQLHFQPFSGGACALDPARGLDLRYSQSGMTIRPRGQDSLVAPAANWSARFSFATIAMDGQSLDEPEDAEPIRIEENRASRVVARDVTEWWINAESGAEHGFTIAASPRPAAERLVVTLALGGSLRPAQDDTGIVFADENGRTRLTYGKLHVFDASRRELRSHMTIHETAAGWGLELSAEIAGAEFPVTVDPVIGVQQEETLASDGAPGDEFGFASDGIGDVMAVSSPGKGSGKVYLFHENQGGAGEWNEAASVVIPPAESPVNGDRFGQSIAVFEDEANAKTYLAVGAPEHDGTGSVFIFERNQGGADNWGFVQILQDIDLTGGDDFGMAVDGLGNTLVIGAPSHGAGAVFMHEVSAGTFSRVQKLTTPPLAHTPVAGDEFGAAVALGGDHMVIGAPGENSENGGAYLLRRGSPFFFLFRLFTDKTEAGARFGALVAMAITGLLLAISMPYDDVTFGPTLVDAGSVFVYAVLATTLAWGFLTGIFGNEAGAMFGSALSINFFYDLAIGARGATSILGVVGGAVFIYLFSRLLFSYDNGSKVVPSTFIDAGMGLGTSLVLLGTALFILGSAYSGSMGAMFRFILAATVLTYLSWQQLFWTQDQIDNRPDITGRPADPDRDGLTNEQEFAMLLIPILFTSIAALGVWAANGYFHFIVQESLVSSGMLLFLQYSLLLNVWYSLGAGPLAGAFSVKVLHSGIQARQLQISVSSLLVLALFMRVATQEL